MSDVLLQMFSLGFLGVVLLKTTPLLFAAIGGAFTQQADILNIGLEGMMLIAAFTAIAAGATAKSWVVGVLAAIGAALLISLLYAVLTLLLKADFIVVGIGINLLAAGASVLIMLILYNSPGATPPSATIELPKWFDQTPLVYLALLSVAVFWFVLYKTPFGVHLRAVGQDLPAATAAGISGVRVKFVSILICGVLCGLGGAQLSMATLGTFTAGMTAGRGFIAVAALTFGRARPVPTFIAALIFGLTEAFADLLNVKGVNSNLANMTPYVITVLALTFAAWDLGKRRRVRAAAAHA